MDDDVEICPDCGEKHRGVKELGVEVADIIAFGTVSAREAMQCLIVASLEIADRIDGPDIGLDSEFIADFISALKPFSGNEDDV